MIKLYNFGPAFGLRETGPFVLKTMAYMKLAGIEFTEVVQGDPRKAPKKKIPYIDDDGVEIGDSTFILNHLKAKFGDPLAEGILRSLQAGVKIAEDLGKAPLTQQYMEFEEKQITAEIVGDNFVLVVLAGSGANLGRVRLEIRKNRGAVERLLAI